MVAGDVGAPLDVEADDQAVAVEGVDVVNPLRNGGGVVGDGGVNDVAEEEDIVGVGEQVAMAADRHFVRFWLR